MGSSSSAPSPALHKAVDVPNLKIAIIGDPEVGKTSILSRYIRNQFSPVYIPTHKAAIENVVRKFNVPGHAKVPITFWDIPGHEDLPLHSSYFTDLDAVIVVVDLSVPASLESAVVWRQTVLSSATFTSSSKLDEEKDKEARDSINQSKKVEDIPFLLLGNKLDLCLEKGGGDVEETHDENLVVSNKVQQLEEVAGQGFTGSIAVSARNNDMSVPTAIQAFLRHTLLGRGLVQRKWVASPDSPQEDRPGGRPRYKRERQLRPVGIDSIDTKFDQAEDILYRVASLQRYQEDSRSKFCGQVVAAGLVAESQDGSLQNCLVALRGRLEGLDLKLQLKLSDEFCHLEVKASTEDAELDKDIRYAIKTFNKEYAAVTRAILSEFPVAELKLSQIESEVDGLCAPHQEVQDPTGHGRAPANHSSVSHISNAGNNASGVRQTAEARAGVAAGCAGGAVERNRAVLRHVARECHDCLAHVQRTVKQAKAAFVW